MREGGCCCGGGAPFHPRVREKGEEIREGEEEEGVTAWSCERLRFHGFLYCFFLLLLGLFYLFLSRFILLRDPTKRLTFMGSHILIK